jgi:hypothetical protein
MVTLPWYGFTAWLICDIIPLRLEVVLATGQGEISEQEYEDKVREAFRPLGIDVVEE